MPPRGQVHSVPSSTPESIEVVPYEQERMGLDLSETKTTLEAEEAIAVYLDLHPTAAKRIQDYRLHHVETVGNHKDALETPTMASIGAGKPFPPLLPEREEYVVEFDGHDDPRHAQNWTLKKKIGISLILVLDSLAATLASSVFSPGGPAIGQHFHVGKETTVLGTSLFVLGYAFGRFVVVPIPRYRS
jgi:DHA1 family multidrug resistance protein-like MFS transporter